MKKLWNKIKDNLFLILIILFTLIIVCVFVMEIIAQFKFDGQYINWRWVPISHLFK